MSPQSSLTAEWDPTGPSIPRFPLQKDAYRVLQQISNGPTAIVYKAICIPQKSLVAIKIIDMSTTEKPLQIIQVVTGSFLLPEHPNILRAHCFFTVENKFWVVMPYIEGGSLQSMISAGFGEGFSPKIIATVILRVLTVLTTMHHVGLAHRGVKPGNILLETNGNVLLSDFGVSTWNYDQEVFCDYVPDFSCSSWSATPLFPVITPPYWVPPEALWSETGFDVMGDVWSFGITAMELFHGRPPIMGCPESRWMLRKISKRFHYSDHYEKGKGGTKTDKKCPPSLQHLIDVCLVIDPSSRTTSERLLSHPLFKEKCRGLPYVAHNLIQGLPGVDKRYKPQPLKPLSLSIAVKIASTLEKKVPRIVIGWNFNFETIEMKPLYHTESLLKEATELTTKSEINTIWSSDMLGIEKRMEGLMALKEKLEAKTQTLAETIARVEQRRLLEQAIIEEEVEEEEEQEQEEEEDDDEDEDEDEEDEDKEEDDEEAELSELSIDEWMVVEELQTRLQGGAQLSRRS